MVVKGNCLCCFMKYNTYPEVAGFGLLFLLALPESPAEAPPASFPPGANDN